MNVREILIKQLKELGADGLCNPGEGCGCGIGDFEPCTCMDINECRAAKRIQPKSDSPDYDDEFPDGYYQVIR